MSALVLPGEGVKRPWGVLLQTKNGVDKGEVLKILRKTPRLVPVRRSEGVEGMNAVLEITRDFGRPRGDMWEVAFWEDILHASGNGVNMVYQVHNESVVVPENVDAVRALLDWRVIGKGL